MGDSMTTEVPMPADTCAATWNWQTGEALVQALGYGKVWPLNPPAPNLSHLLTVGRPSVGSRKVIVVHPGSNREMNQWGVANFAAVAANLAGDFEVRWIAHGPAAPAAPDGARLIRVGSLAELAQEAAQADLFLGNNSGPMHIANAVNCAGVVIDGPSGFGWDPQWHPERWQVLRHPHLPCQPCDRPNTETKACANLASPMACLKYWTPASVEAVCREWLDRMATGPA